MAGRLLLVDSEQSRADLLVKHLRAAGYWVGRCAEMGRVLACLAAQLPDCLILRGAPADPVLCRQLREGGQTLPILVLAAGDHYSERVQLLHAGADDVLAAPFALDELHARVLALLRRARMGVNDSAGSVVSYGDLLVNTDDRQVTRAGQLIRLTVKEYELLLFLLRHHQQVLPRQRILHAVWGESWVGDDNLLDVYIRYLRKKLERPDLDPLIHTVRGVGFVLK